MFGPGPRASGTGNRRQIGRSIRGESKPLHQEADGLALRCGPGSTLKILDATDAQAGAVG
jgi:hypothetical protein